MYPTVLKISLHQAGSAHHACRVVSGWVTVHSSCVTPCVHSPGAPQLLSVASLSARAIKPVAAAPPAAVLAVGATVHTHEQTRTRTRHRSAHSDIYVLVSLADTNVSTAPSRLIALRAKEHSRRYMIEKFMIDPTTSVLKTKSSSLSPQLGREDISPITDAPTPMICTGKAYEHSEQETCCLSEHLRLCLVRSSCHARTGVRCAERVVAPACAGVL